MAEEKRYYIITDDTRLKNALQRAQGLYEAVKDHKSGAVVAACVIENAPRIIGELIGSFAVETETFNTNS